MSRSSWLSWQGKAGATCIHGEVSPVVTPTCLQNLEVRYEGDYESIMRSRNDAGRRTKTDSSKG